MKYIEAEDVVDVMEETCDQAQDNGAVPVPVFPFETRDEVLREFARRLAFPSYFGRNMDALADCMSDFVHALVGPTALVVGFDPQFATSGEARMIEEILADAERQAPSYTPLSVTVVRPAAASV